MNMKPIALCLLIPFLALTAYTIMDVGYIGIFEYHLHSSAGWQVFTDLVIGMILIMIWMYRDAKKNGSNPWPYLIATCFLGSIAPLTYLVLRKQS